MSESRINPPKASAMAHYDGERIVLDEPLELTNGTPLVVTMLPQMNDAERAEWARLSAAGLARAHSTREPEYSPSETKPNRFLAVLIGSAYLMVVAQIFSQATNRPFGATFSVTIIGSLIIMAALSALGVKAYRNKNTRIRFTFSTVFLVSIPVSVFLAAIGALLRQVPASEFRELGIVGWCLISVFGILVMLISMLILVSFAEALVWLAVSLFRWQRAVLHHARKP
jgi:hypothetical protein